MSLQYLNFSIHMLILDIRDLFLGLFGTRGFEFLLVGYIFPSFPTFSPVRSGDSVVRCREGYPFLVIPIYIYIITVHKVFMIYYIKFLVCRRRNNESRSISIQTSIRKMLAGNCNSPRE